MAKRMGTSLLLLAALACLAQLLTPVASVDVDFGLFDGSLTNDLSKVATYLAKKYSDPDTLENTLYPGGLPTGVAYCYTGSVNATDLATMCQDVVNQTSSADATGTYTLTFASFSPDIKLPWASFFLPSAGSAISLTGDNATVAACTSYLTTPTKPVIITLAYGEKSSKFNVTDDKLVIASGGGATVDVFTQRSYLAGTILWEFLPPVDKLGVPTGGILPVDPSSSLSFRAGFSQNSQNDDCSQQNEYKYLNIQRAVRGWDITGVTNQVDTKGLNNFCDCAKLCTLQPTTCVAWVYKFQPAIDPPTAPNHKRVCTIYSNFNLPSAVTFNWKPLNGNPPGIVPAGNNPQVTAANGFQQAGAITGQCTHSNTNDQDKACASGIAFQLQGGGFAV